MAVFLAIVGILLWLIGLFIGVMPVITSGIAGSLIFVAGCVMFGAAAIVDAIKDLQGVIKNAQAPANKLGKAVEQIHG